MKLGSVQIDPDSDHLGYRVEELCAGAQALSVRNMNSIAAVKAEVSRQVGIRLQRGEDGLRFLEGWNRLEGQEVGVCCGHDGNASAVETAPVERTSKHSPP